MKKAQTWERFINSIEDGRFTLDGRHLLPQETGGNSVYLDLSRCGLVSLEGLPNILNVGLDCSYNKLTSLKGCPQIINGDFCCNHNNLKTLEGGPQSGVKTYACYGMEPSLTTLKGIPEIVDGDLYAFNNMIFDVEYLPQQINGNLDIDTIYGTGVIDFHNIHNRLKTLNGSLRAIIHDNNNYAVYPLNVLGILLIKNIQTISMNPPLISLILTKYLNAGKVALYKCAQELTQAGFLDAARL